LQSKEIKSTGNGHLSFFDDFLCNEEFFYLNPNSKTLETISELCKIIAFATRKKWFLSSLLDMVSRVLTPLGMKSLH